MFVAHCPTRDARVLLGPRRITGMVNTPRGIVLELECCAGERVLLLTGRASAEGGALPD